MLRKIATDRQSYPVCRFRNLSEHLLGSMDYMMIYIYYSLLNNAMSCSDYTASNERMINVDVGLLGCNACKYKSTQRYNLEDQHRHLHRCENLKSYDD
jgi:hypothetical protein